MNERQRNATNVRKYGESKTTRIMMATVPHVTSGSGLRKFQADGFLFDRVYTVGSVWGFLNVKVGGIESDKGALLG